MGEPSLRAMPTPLTSGRFYREVAAKDVLALALFGLVLRPAIAYEFEVLQSAQQGNVLSMLGFLMAAGIIGAFELSYAKTQLASAWQRWLAHAAKFLVHLAVCMLVWIGYLTMQVGGGFFNDWILAAGVIIVAAVFLFDVWDAVGAALQQLSTTDAPESLPR